MISVLTPKDLAVLEIVTGQRLPESVDHDTLARLVTEGYLVADRNGAVQATEMAVRATDTEGMKTC